MDKAIRFDYIKIAIERYNNIEEYPEFDTMTTLDIIDDLTTKKNCEKVIQKLKS